MIIIELQSLHQSNQIIRIIFNMLSKILLCILTFTIIQISTKPLVGNKVIVALNCGAKDIEVQSADKSFKYKPDEIFVSGRSVDVDYHTNLEAKQADIKYTFEKRIYMYERHTYDEMIYSLPYKLGKITLILKFAEMYFRNPGERVFNIKIGNKIVKQDLDIVQQTGSKYAAHEEYIEIDVRKDGVYFEGVKINGGIVKDKLKLSFAKGKADNPIIQGIIVYHDSIDNSPKVEYKTMKQKWDTQKQIQRAIKQEEALKDIVAVQKKKEKILIRNDQLIIQNPEKDSQKKPSPEKFGFLRRLAMGPVGVIFWILFIAGNIHILYKYVFLMDSNSTHSKKE